MLGIGGCVIVLFVTSDAIFRCVVVIVVGVALHTGNIGVFAIKLVEFVVE